MIFSVVIFAMLSVMTEARCKRKNAIKAALDADAAYYKAVNRHEYNEAVKYTWCKGTATLIEPIGPKGNCIAVTNSFPVTLNFFSDIEFTPIIRDVRYFNNGTVSIHSADIIVINGTTVAAHDSYRWYDAKPGTCLYKMSTLYAVNWLCLEPQDRGCGCPLYYGQE